MGSASFSYEKKTHEINFNLSIQEVIIKPQ